MGFGKRAIKSRRRPLLVMQASVVEVKASENCLAHAIIILIAQAENNPNYKAYRKDRKIRSVVQNMLAKTGDVLSGGVGIPELIKVIEHFQEYKINVYQVLACEYNV